MATYYKYAERNVDSQINWAEVGKNLTDMLKEEVRIREEKKAAIDQASREFGEKLEQAPQGENRPLNAWTLQYADDAQQARLLQDRLLKSGRLKLKDYNIMRQNINDGTKNMFLLSAEYQEEFARKMERMKSNDPATKSQALEQYAMETVEGFANFTRSKPLINPTDYSVSIAMMKPDPSKGGVLIPTDEIVSVNALRNRIKSDFNYFDVDKSNETIAKRLADYVTVNIDKGTATKTGFVTAVSDAMNRPDYQKAMDDAIESQLQNPYNISSVLTENIGIEDVTGKPFGFTSDPAAAKANKNLILVKTVNDQLTPEFSQEQKDAVKAFMKGQIEQMIKHDQTVNPYAEPRKDPPRGFDPNWFAWNQQKKEQGFAVNAWNTVATATSLADKTIALQQVTSTPYAKASGLVDVNMDPRKAMSPSPQEGMIPINIVYGGQNAAASTTRWIPPGLTLEQWAQVGSEITGVSNTLEVMRGSGGGDPNMVLGGVNLNFSGLRSQRAGAQPSGSGAGLVNRVLSLFR